MSGLLGRWRSWLVGVGAHSNEVMPVNEMALPVWRAPAGLMAPGTPVARPARTPEARQQERRRRGR